MRKSHCASPERYKRNAQDALALIRPITRQNPADPKASPTPAPHADSTR